MDTTNSFRIGILKKRNGFTLVELLVVIAIVGILLTVALASYSTVQKKSRDGRRKQDLQAFQQAMEQYYTDTNVYPTALPGLVNSKTYLQTIPNDPKGTPYPSPQVGVAGSSYCLCTALESDRGNYTDAACTQPTPGTYYCIQSQQ